MDFVKQVVPGRRDNTDMSENNVRREHVKGNVARHLHLSFWNIINKIICSRMSSKLILPSFRRTLHKCKKKEFESFKKYINIKLAEMSEPTNHKMRLQEAMKRLEEVEC
ncbi:hypothetical protein CHARACLAT_030227 [Characodon lateralis]|uniref:Uncharacterized protein n=1 Tax=Characodon lateralis TaxID=208331 RepID=A0ABU7DZF0_9TELE|nr:hypothetical protein [Characodon lateralis]